MRGTGGTSHLTCSVRWNRATSPPRSTVFPPKSKSSPLPGFSVDQRSITAHRGHRPIGPFASVKTVKPDAYRRSAHGLSNSVRASRTNRAIGNPGGAINGTWMKGSSRRMASTTLAGGRSIKKAIPPQSRPAPTPCQNRSAVLSPVTQGPPIGPLGADHRPAQALRRRPRKRSCRASSIASTRA